MMRSLYSGVSGLRNHQTRMDVIGNNISNVNTAGFKTSRVVFQDIYSQTSKYASAGTPDVVGGTNPIQIGLGVTLASIDVLHKSAATARTDNPTDLAIEGDGFFVVDTNGTTTAGGLMYTRAGNLYIDNAFNLVTANGHSVMGVMGATDPGSTAITTLEPIVLSGYTGIAIDDTGTITGINDTSGDKETIGYLALANFVNPPGLEKKGNNLYAASSNSGVPVYYKSQSGGTGKINPGGLEMSNVDLAYEFTDMIVTQRGFQANSRVITTSDTMLEELVNLKR